MSLSFFRYYCLLVWSAAALVCDGFQTVIPLSPSPSRIHHDIVSSSTTRLSVSKILPSDDDEQECGLPNSGPASVFGRPVRPETQEWNRDFVKTCKSLLFDTLFQGTSLSRSYARFYALENIARMPYFSYVSVLHLYESLGNWRKAEYLKVHFSESWNEQHHLLIMEEMGGSERFADRFVSQHVAFFYYWLVIGLYIYNPTLAYSLNQAVEEEAYATYDNFIGTHKEYLETQPAPDTAIKYYTGNDMYLFDAMHFDEEGTREVRRPKMETLFDAFMAVRDDELEHVKTMAYLQDDSCR